MWQNMKGIQKKLCLANDEVLSLSLRGEGRKNIIDVILNLSQ
jgi:hypothetical protein